MKDGLPSSEVYNVMQDSKGYIWFCTDAGVSRFDGYSFRNYSSSNGLKDNTVFGSCEDRKGRIWFRTMSGRLFYYKNDSIYGIDANAKINEELHNGVISSLYLDAGDTIWCGVGTGQGFFKVAPPYKKSDITFFDPGHTGYLVEIDKSGMIWGYSVPRSEYKKLYHTWSEVIRFDRHGKRIGRVAELELPSSPAVIKTHSGNFIMTSYKDIYSVDEKANFIIPEIRFYSLFEDRRFNLWAGTSRDGIYYFEGGRLKGAKPSHYLKGLSISSITEDREGGFWFTTLENGVFYMTSPDFLYFNKENGMSDNKVLAIIQKDHSHVAAGLANGDIYVMSKDSLGLFKKAGTGPGETSLYRFFLNPSDHEIIVGAPFSFMFSFKDAHSWVYLSKERVPNALKCFTRDKEGFVWAGNYRFLSKLDLKGKGVLENHLSESRILSLYADANNTIWAGCINGLWSFKDGKFKYYGTENPLFKNRIDDIKVSADSIWWFATKGSGLIVKRRNDIFTIDESKGLSSNICKSIYIDEEGTVWVGTNSGLNKITMKKWGSPVVSIYSSEDGLLSNEINEVVKTGNQVWAATNQGVVVFNSGAPFSNQTPPPVYISSLEINSVSTQLSDSFRLKYFENYLKINFTGISYKRGLKMKYQYMLEGIDSKWNYTYSNNLQYTTLPPGAYTFKVYALNNDGVKSAEPARFYFVISKPFWKEWWFMALVLLIVTGSVIGAVTYRIELLKRRAVEKSEVNRKMADLKLMALRAQMNPHFIFNSINSIQLFILKNDSESAHKHLSRFSRLIRNVLENSKHEYIGLGVEIETLEHYIELERLRFSSKFDYKITVDEKVDIKSILISPLLIQPYVENAIWHGLMHLKDRQGKLEIRLEKQGQLLKCTVEDNGIGRKHSAEFKKGKDHKSTGLSLNKERVEIINTLHNSTEGVHFIDKENEDGTPIGTQVDIYIPININYSEYA